MLKKTLIALYVVVVAVMAAATIAEKYQGTSFVASHVYGAWWFSALWAVLAALAIVYFLKRRVRRLSAVVLHLSFVVILAGALLTHLTARRGMIHVRTGSAVSHYVVADEQGVHEETLPFAVSLERFSVKRHEGTMAAADYESHLRIVQGTDTSRVTVSMNNIYSRSNIRLYQSSYDEDGQGTYLAVNSDPWGIPLTYLGYALLFLALVWILIDPKGAYREVWRKMMRTGASLALLAGLLTLVPTSAFSSNQSQPLPHALPQDVAAEFGKLNILYNDRICPLQTYALDFTKKLCGKRSYRGLTAEQVLTGFLFWSNEWSGEPIVKVKNAALRDRLHLPAFSSVDAFFSDASGYIIGPYLQEYYGGQNDKLHQEAAKLDDRLQLIMQLRNGATLKVFPFAQSEEVAWYAPSSQLPETMEPERKQYISSIFGILNQDAQAGNHARMTETLHKMQQYQQRYGGRSLPSARRLKAERIYNAIPFATILFMVNLTMGFLSLLYTMFRLVRKKSSGTVATGFQWLVFALSLAALTACLALRWIITGRAPMANGYETMLILAWFIMFIAAVGSLLLPRSTHSLLLSFGFLLSGFFLLVSHISQMDPQISHIMPVLNSPLLTLHVSVIMMSFALLSLTFLCGVVGATCCAFSLREASESLMLLSQLFLYPALTTLGIGIFVGAIWANVSWGTYWSWDPKEVWALITFMIYAVGVHQRSLPWLRRPLAYHVFCIVAFLSILMTYFGVNYFLGGMHSYA